jgi:hypothetical protein
MNRIHRALLVASALAVASVASAQTTGGTAGTPGTATGNGGVNQAGTGTATVELAAAPTITNTTGGGVTRGTIDGSNLLGGFYANPLYQGARSVSGDLTNVIAPGGFGQATFTTGGAAGVGGGGNATAGRGGATAGRAGGATTGLQTGGSTLGGSTLGGGAAGGLGNAAGGGRQAGGFGGGQGGLGGANNSQNSNQQLSTGRSIAYTQTLRFGVAPMTMTAVQTEVVNTLATSSVPGANQVQAIAGDFGTVILTGVAMDEDNAKLIEGIVMLTPGVKQVKNELKFPKTAP